MKEKNSLSIVTRGLKLFNDVDEHVKNLMKSVLEKILKEEMNIYLGYEKHEQKKGTGNARNGTYVRKVKMESGVCDLHIPRDRKGTFDSPLIQRYNQNRTIFENSLISLYAKGVLTQDIQAHLEGLYGERVPPTFVSIVTERLMSAAYEWQQRPLQDVYLVVYFETIFYKGRSEDTSIAKVIYKCIGIDLNGNKDILGLWIYESEDTSYWITIMNELKTRGVKDVFIACIDGLVGLGDAVLSVFPKTDLEHCIIRMIRTAMKYIPGKHRAAFFEDLKELYTAVSKGQAEYRLLVS